MIVIKILNKFRKGNLEITLVQTDKPILPAKPGIRIENVRVKKNSLFKKVISKFGLKK